MRKRKDNGEISVHAIAGAHVVLLGLDATEEAADGLLGFSIYRRRGRTGKEWPLGGGKIFEDIHNEDDLVKSDEAPIQGFLWGDYTAHPDTTYSYRVVPQYGEPGALEPGDSATVTVKTEGNEDRTHAVYFNRGVAGSQAFSRKFGDHRKWYLVENRGRVQARELVKPEQVPPEEGVYQWLSRGLEKALLDFIGQAQGPEYALRAAVYEFTYPPAIQAFVDALERGVDVKIVHHAKRNGTFRLKARRDPKDGSEDWQVNTTTTWESGTPAAKTYKNRYLARELVKDDVCRAATNAVSQIGLANPDYLEAFDEMMIERKITQISHNKFIVLLKRGKPIQVWTGSTNFTAGGIFGQSNVGHIVRDEKVAQKYLKYWEMLATDPAKKDMQNWMARHSPDIKAQPRRNSITPIFSPRSKRQKTMLDWYASRIAAAKNSVFFTAAFSVDKRFLRHFSQRKKVSGDQPYQRYILLEDRSGPMWDKYRAMARVGQNRIAWGDVLKPRDDGEERLIETLTGLNDHVSFLHTKYMLIDPLSDDPIVISGSANFSENSTTANDENMLVIRGDTRVADIFVGEFMRLFNHFHSRNKANALTARQAARSHYLIPDDSWTQLYYDEAAQECHERLLFR